MQEHKSFEKEKPKKLGKYRFPGFVMGVKVPTADTVEGKKYALEGALKQLKRMVKEAGIIEELRDRQVYDKPSVRKREIKKAAVRRNYYEDLKQKESDKKGL